MEFSELMSALCSGALLTLQVFIIALPCSLVLGILITAPLGAICIDRTKNRLLRPE